MERKIIYTILGFGCGYAFGILSLSLIFEVITGEVLYLGQYSFLIAILFLGAPVAWLGLRLAKKKNVKEEQYSQVQNESIRGYLYIVGSILGIQSLISLVIFIAGFLILRSFGVGLQDFITILNQNKIIAAAIGIPSGIVMSWIGVWYVLRKGFLKKFHSPLKISLWVVVISVVLGYQQIMQAPLLFLLSLAVALCSLFYFLDRAIKKIV